METIDDLLRQAADDLHQQTLATLNIDAELDAVRQTPARSAAVVHRRSTRRWRWAAAAVAAAAAAVGAVAIARDTERRITPATSPHSSLQPADTSAEPEETPYRPLRAIAQTAAPPESCTTSPLPPPVLTDGSSPGEARLGEQASVQYAQWGTGDAAVRQALEPAPTTGFGTMAPFDGERPKNGERPGILTRPGFQAIVVTSPSWLLGGPAQISVLDESHLCVRNYFLSDATSGQTALDLANRWLDILSTGHQPDPTGRTLSVASLPGDPFSPDLTLSAAVANDPSILKFDLVGFSPTMAAVRSDGLLVVAQPSPDSTVGELKLISVNNDDRQQDTGILVPSDALLRFGAFGNLYVCGATDGKAVISAYQPNAGSGWRWLATATAAPATEQSCVPTQSGARSGPGGPTVGLGFDPSIDIVRAVEDPSGSNTVERLTGATVIHRWDFRVGEIAPSTPSGQAAIDCRADCSAQMYPGPAGTAVFAAHLDGGRAPMAVFVMDDRPISGHAWLDPSIDQVLGVVGNDLIAISTTNDRSSIVRLGLTSVLDHQFGG